MLFAALELEREPLQWVEFPAAVIGWVQTAGTIATAGLITWLLAYFLQGRLALQRALSAPLSRPQAALNPAPVWTREAVIFAALTSTALAGYILAGLVRVGEVLFTEEPLPGPEPTPGSTPLFGSFSEILLTLASVAALLAVLFPLAQAIVMRLSGRRIWALARLSLKEAVRSKVVLVFSLMAVVFLFADWFVPYKPEDQLRNYVRAIYWSMPPLFILTAGLLGSFSIPNDLRSQAMFTIVTKPVERMEIVLGRFLGYGILLTAGLAALSCLSLLYLVRGVGDKAREESFRARMPIYGQLAFAGTSKASAGDSVGRLWDYRSYITGPNPQEPNRPRQYAIWSFSQLPDLEDQTTLQVQITFDIFRLNKGRENQGVPCSFFFSEGRLSAAQVETLAEKYKAAYSELYTAFVNPQAGKPNPEAARLFKGLNTTHKTEARLRIEEYLCRQLGLHMIAGWEVTDYHTQTLLVPASFFAALAQRSPEPGAPAFRVFMRVDEDPGRQTQMVGMARRDLYLLPAEGPFWINFLKGMMGMWFTVLLVLGLAIAISTYLSGVISWLCTMFLFGAGMAGDFIRDIAQGRFDAGGPLEAGIRVATNRASYTPLEGTAHEIVRGVDKGFQWILRRFLDILPDVSRFDLHEYVASGFDISWSQVLLLDNLIPLVGYLLPWSILAYYLMRFREVANPN